MDVNTLPIDEYFAKALVLVREAGEIVRTQITKEKTVDLKSSEVDLVTETDKQVETLLVSSLLESYPDHKFIGEESVASGKPCDLTSTPTWIIDPVDGTMNFVHGYPNVCVSVALWVNKMPYIGIVYNPIQDLMFSAQKGGGAYLNDKKISVSSQTDLGKALLIMEFGTSREPEKMNVVFDNMKQLIPIVHGCRSTGCASLNIAMVAMGVADCYFEFGIHVWDIAAGWLLVEEAGGVVLDPSGGPADPLSRRFLCAATKEVGEKIIPRIKQFYMKRD